jgi:hypothetical protein
VGRKTYAKNQPAPQLIISGQLDNILLNTAEQEKRDEAKMDCHCLPDSKHRPGPDTRFTPADEQPDHGLERRSKNPDAFLL